MTKKPNSSPHFLQADVIRVVAIFAVVGIHTLTPIYARPDFFGGKFWWVCFLLNCLFRVSVPLFIMLSGYLVLPKIISLKDHLRKTLTRIGVPLLSFYLLTHLVAFISAQLRHEFYDPWTLLHNLNKNTYTYLYFLVVLFFLYLLTPFFQLLFQAKNKQLQTYVIIFFFINAALSTLARYVSLRTGDVFHTYTLWIVWVGYYLYGYFVRQQQDEHTFILKKEWLWLAAGYLVTVIFGYLSLSWHIQGNNLFYIGGQTYPEEYLSLSVIAMSIATFRLMISMKLPIFFWRVKVVSVLQTLAQLSFGIYLVHPIVMDVLNKFCGVTADSPFMPNLISYVIVNAALTFGLSIVIAAVLYSTPLLQKIVGRSSPFSR